MPVQAVFFDLGETLIDETRHWAVWADALNIPRFTLFGLIGGLAERGEHHRQVFQLLRPGTDIDQMEAQLRPALRWRTSDFYPDAAPCLARLRADGYRTGIAGNQPADMEAAITLMNIPVDTIASSANWGVEKPSIQFFQKIVQACQMSPWEIAYVGDRLDNDILPAHEAGLKTVFIRRGPWGHLHSMRSDMDMADLAITSLSDLPDRLLEL